MNFYKIKERSNKMFKINKYILLRRKLPQLESVRYMADSNCPPKYECKQPPPSRSDDYLEQCRLRLRHPLFKEKHIVDPRIFRNIFFFICVPITLGLLINIYYIHPEPFKRPKFVDFPYLRIRRQPFAWDPVRTLFHNPLCNALPKIGYEVEVPEEQEIDPFDL